MAAAFAEVLCGANIGANQYISDSLTSVTANNNTAKQIKTDITTAIKHADIAYELAK